MAKRAKKFVSINSLLKNSSLSAIIGLLLLTFFKFIEPLVDTQHTTLPSSDSPVQLYSNQTKADLSQLFITAINQANQSINLVIYSLMDQQVLNALHRKCQEGIPVYIVCDAKASRGISQNLPKAQIVRRAGKGLTHQKILVIDEKLVLAGSANMTSDSLRLHGNLVGAIHNPELAKKITAKIQSMNEDGYFIPFKSMETLEKGQHLKFYMLPDDVTASKKVVELLRSAKKTIKIAMFTWTRKDFAEELIDAKERGVKVEVVMDRYCGSGAGKSIVRLLQSSGVSTRLSTGQGLLHHKFAYIDDEILINGSANWTKNAFKLNDDCFFVLSPLTEQQKGLMDQLWNAIQAESQIVAIK